MSVESSQPIDRCVCANVTFEAMQKWLTQTGERDLHSLRSRFNCGAGCALCVPYVRAMMATGRVRFAVNDEAIRNPQRSSDPSL